MRNPQPEPRAVDVASAPQGDQARRIEVQGVVQGVGFRPFVYRLADELGVRGRILNDVDGVVVEATAPAAVLDVFVARLADEAPPAARVEDIRCRPAAVREQPGFVIDESRGEGRRRASIPADLPTCPRCLAEVLDPADRRHGYAFTNCTDCGPRFTIALEVPYDRERTSMASFEMCPECRAEYESPASRRFHAEPNACPACGPRLGLLGPDAVSPVEGNPMAGAAAALREGRLVAVKGLGGYHLACDATSDEAVARLRRRKHRDAKPFAVMVADLEEASAVVRLDAASRELLLGQERPIVLAPRRTDCSAPDAGAGALAESTAIAGDASIRIAEAVAPGCARLGVFLPYTPLHHLLLTAVGRPLVMTSANRSDEPSVHREAELEEALLGIADLFLVHDREIVTRTDDSVATVVAGRPTVLRRSRGYVPRPVRLAGPGLDGPAVLACGAHLKNTFCIAVGRDAWLGPHIGDLESLEAGVCLSRSIDRMERFLGVHAAVLACDLHPDYFSTRYALARPADQRVAVQHHHAHVAATMAENGLDGPVFGLAWDGTGHGSDGGAWGGELLLADYAGFERLATFRPLRLAGGDLAVRQIWRVAVAAADDAFGSQAPVDSLSLGRDIEPRRLDLVRRMLATGVHTTSAHGVGRWFDAVAALCLGLPEAAWEGQAAVRLEDAAARSRATPSPYPFRIDDAAMPWQVDLRPAVCRIVVDILGRRDPTEIAADFHETLAAVAAELVRMAVAARGHHPVALGGGCFVNGRLVAGIERQLCGRTEVFRPRDVPPGDGGIALGQAAVARARLAAQGLA